MGKFKKPKYLILSISIIISSLFAINSYFSIKYLKSCDKSRWPKGTFTYNASIGYEMSPSFSSTMLDGSYGIYSHKLSYRIPKFVNNSTIEQGGVLCVGCSFTYGDGVEAEQTFPYLIAESLLLPSYNYGVCGYSYTSVILQLRELKRRGILDTLKPTILILGATNGLIGRSLAPFIPTDNDIPFVYPYIAKKDGKIQIAKQPNMFSIKYLSDLEKEYFSNRGEKLTVTLKRFYLMFQTAPRILYTNLIKKKCLYQTSDINSFELYDFLITEIKKVISPYRMEFIILWMPTELNQSLDKGLKEVVEKHNDIILVNGIDAIEKYNIEDKEYLHIHPQPKAHQAYANEVVARVIHNTGLAEIRP